MSEPWSLLWDLAGYVLILNDCIRLLESRHDLSRSCLEYPPRSCMVRCEVLVRSYIYPDNSLFATQVTALV